MYEFITRDKDKKTPLYIKLKQAIIDDIMIGKYENMQKLPSRRKLAAELGVSTTTVNNAYQALVDDGYALTIDRSGFFVISNVAAEDIYSDVKWESNDEYIYNFTYNACDISCINEQAFKVIERSLRRDNFKDLLVHGDKRGEKEFRVALSQMLYLRRGIDCRISELFLGAGIQHLLTVIVMTLGTDKVYGFENPTDFKLYVWLRNLGVDVRLVNISVCGAVKPEELDTAGIDVFFVMPENQLPTGYRASQKERQALADWCAQNGKYIIEVASDGNLNYVSSKLDTIYTLSGGHNVFYLESFEYTIAPNIKMAFLVLPNDVIDGVMRRLALYSPLVTAAEQEICRELISSGQFDRMIENKTAVMKKKRDLLISYTNSSKLAGKIRFLNYESGMNMIGMLDSPERGGELSRVAYENGVKIFEMTKFLQVPNDTIEKNAFVFGFAEPKIVEIGDAVSRLERAWQSNS